ncbi:hypothetical protein BC938DRAFT_477315 [Jimgerdemannia flammicorona]|uniref:Uncharacterized protein n=1 Tax=Jimgerdemannia flammicorona TaxID=994334 RepID=A0A433QPH7_9FUNG|nr:hypothetical protein BC938DRAFT_477315 [Jimgerdemannia flammicorona]
MPKKGTNVSLVDFMTFKGLRNNRKTKQNNRKTKQNKPVQDAVAAGAAALGMHDNHKHHKPKRRNLLSLRA